MRSVLINCSATVKTPDGSCREAAQFNKSLTISILPAPTARCNGVQPPLSFAFMSAPFSNKSLAVSALPPYCATLISCPVASGSFCKTTGFEFVFSATRIGGITVTSRFVWCFQTIIDATQTLIIMKTAAKIQAAVGLDFGNEIDSLQCGHGASCPANSIGKTRCPPHFGQLIFVSFI